MGNSKQYVRKVRYIVSECIIGRHIDEVCEDERLSTNQVLDLLIHTCEGLSCAHSAGFLHRDIKPSNILVDGSLCPKLIDFGLAKSIAAPPSELTEPGSSGPPGTLAYMSPEQLEATAQVDERSDIYSLGAVAYSLFSPNRRPPHGELKNPVQYITSRLRRDPPRIAANSDVSTHLAAVIGKAVRAKRFRRYRSVEALRRDLEACRYGRWTSIQKWWRAGTVAPIVSIVGTLAIILAIHSCGKLKDALQEARTERLQVQSDLDHHRSHTFGRFVVDDVCVDFENCAFLIPPGFEVTFTLDAGADYTDYIKFRLAIDVTDVSGRRLDGNTTPRRDPPEGPFVDIGAYGGENKDPNPGPETKVFRTPKPRKVLVDELQVDETLPYYVLSELETIVLRKGKRIEDIRVRIWRPLPSGNGFELDTGVADFSATIEWRKY